MFYRERNVSLTTLLLSPFLAPPQPLRVKDLPFCLVNCKIWLMFTDGQGAIKSPCLCSGSLFLYFLLSFCVLDLPAAPGERRPSLSFSASTKHHCCSFVLYSGQGLVTVQNLS